MKKDEKERKMSELDDLYEQAELTPNISNTELMDYNVLSNVQMSDVNYDEEVKKTYDDSLNVVKNMAALYFDDNENILTNNYIKDKIRTDAKNLSDLVFLQEMAKKTIIKQFEQVDLAEASPRLFETMFQGMKEIREIIKQSSSVTSTMQNFYKELYNDLLERKKDDLNIEENNSSTGTILNMNDLNKKLDEMCKINKTK